MPACIFDRGTGTPLTPDDFERRITRCRKRVYNRILRTVGNPNDAEDLTQETLLRAWTHLKSFDVMRSFDSWVFRIATNLCIDHIRRRKRKPTVSLEALAEGSSGQQASHQELADNSNDPAVRLAANEIDERLLDGIRALSKSHRRCLALFGGELSYEEIARILNCPSGTVRSRLHRARTCLRNEVTSRGYLLPAALGTNP